jgi:hypothetical protein
MIDQVSFEELVENGSILRFNIPPRNKKRVLFHMRLTFMRMRPWQRRKRR